MPVSATAHVCEQKTLFVCLFVCRSVCVVYMCMGGGGGGGGGVCVCVVCMGGGGGVCGVYVHRRW